MNKIIAALLFAMVLFVSQAQAGGGQFSLFAGYMNPGDLTFNNVQQAVGDLRGTSIYGARIEKDFLKILGIEQNFEFSPRLINSSLFPDQAADLRGFLYSSNLVVNIPLGRFVPYATAGLGLVKPWGAKFVNLDTTFAGNYGGGIKLNRLAGPVGLRFDVRGWKTSEIFSSSSGANIFEATGAITFTWGGK
jgi:hypothetical protein